MVISYVSDERFERCECRQGMRAELKVPGEEMSSVADLTMNALIQYFRWNFKVFWQSDRRKLDDTRNMKIKTFSIVTRITLL